VDNDEIQNLLMGHETRSHLPSCLNKHNFHFWAKENPPSTAYETVTQREDYSVLRFSDF
jgi:hypothetical protein